MLKTIHQKLSTISDGERDQRGRGANVRASAGRYEDDVGSGGDLGMYKPQLGSAETAVEAMKSKMSRSQTRFSTPRDKNIIITISLACMQN